MDVLSEVLKVVRLNGAVFYNAEFSAPWSVRSPQSLALAPYVRCDGGHVVIYHLVTDGAAWARLEDSQQRVQLAAGDIVIFPHGDPHVMGHGSSVEPIDNGKHLETLFSQGLNVMRMGGGGEQTKFVCGYLACDTQLKDLLLGSLPPILKVNIRSDPSGAWLENSIRFSVAHAASSAAGGEAVLAKLSEALFIETLRRYIATMPEDQTGWLAGARDAEVGRALALLHRNPAQPWTIASLAERVGVSRSVLAERFRFYLDEPPIAYLTRWRLQLGARMLKSTSQGVAQIAAQAGYESEAAFNRAFKRHFGVPPARFRRAPSAAAGAS